MNPKILCVDDEPQILDAYKRTLRKTFSVDTALSGEEGLQKQKELGPYAVVVSDLKMPGMDGIRFLSKMRGSASDTVRIMVTGQAELSAAIAAVNQGEIFRFLTKPCSDELFVGAVEAAVEQYRLVTAEKELLHVLCHDLSNHFSVLKSVLSMKEFDPEFSLDENLADMTKAVDNGLDVITMVREMRKIKEKNLPVAPVSLIEIINESNTLLKNKLTQKSIELSVNIDQTALVLAEKRSLVNSVINNLLTNAIKFSKKGSKIRVLSENSADSVLLSIRDYGIGMPPKTLSNLFDLGKQTSRRGTDGEEGTGFGMPLVKKFVELYGGELEVSSREPESAPEDHGTEIRIKFRKP